MRYLLIILLLAGCSTVTKAKREVANGVDSYCHSMTLAEREVFRNEINAALAEKGNSIKVTCKGDPN